MKTKKTQKVHFFSYAPDQATCRVRGADLAITLVPSEVTCAKCIDYAMGNILHSWEWLLEKYLYAPPSEERNRGVEEARKRVLDRLRVEQDVLDRKIKFVENFPQDVERCDIDDLRKVLHAHIAMTDPDLEVLLIISNMRKVASEMPSGEAQTALSDAIDSLQYKYEADIESVRSRKEDAKNRLEHIAMEREA